MSAYPNLTPRVGASAVLLLSGGMDSAALAAAVRPARTLSIDYGQRPAIAELRAARAVAQHLGVAHAELRVDLSSIGAGLLSADPPGASGSADSAPTPHPLPAGPPAPSPEWWPLRNQLLCSIAAAWALSHTTVAGTPLTSVLTATVAGDGARHVDGTREFYDALDTATRMQEGHIGVHAPSIALTAAELVTVAGADAALLGWTHSCHRSNAPCAECPGCWKRADVLTQLGLLGHASPRGNEDSSPGSGK